MQKLIPNVNENHSPVLLSFRVLSDGSLLVKKGSSTIIKSNSSAVVKGGLIKDFKDDVLEDIGLVQKCFTTWMAEIRSKYKGEVKSSYHDESILITSIKYTKVIKTLVVASLSDKVVKSSSSLITDSNDTVSPSVSDPSESKALKVTSALSPVTPKIHSRHYSTWSGGMGDGNDIGVEMGFLSPITKIVKDPKVEAVCLKRLPSLIKLERSSNGSFKFNLDGVNLLHSQRLKEVLDEIIKKVRDVESINAKGYVNTTRVSDYPILKTYLDTYVKSKKLEKLDTDTLAGLSTVERLEKLDSILTLREKRVLIVWFYSLFNLNMFYLIIDVLDRLGLGLGKSTTQLDSILETAALTDCEKTLIADLIVDLKTYAIKLYGNLNPSIRESLRQRGMSVAENIYCGFDTEYKNIDMKSNKILSAQWAVNSKIVLTLPYLSEYDLSGMNTSTGEIYPINSMWFDQEKLQFGLLQNEIREFISKVRLIRYSSNDESIKSITKGLIEKGIPYFIESGKINYSFPRTAIKTYFKDTDLDKLNLSKLVQIGINLESKDMDSSRVGLYSLLKELNVESKGSKVEQPGDPKPDSNYVNLVQPDGMSTEIIDPSLESLKPRKYKGSSNRTYKGGFTSEPISLTTRRNFHIIGHLTQADLCFLTDFEELKNNLDIVNKCMVTLGKSDIKRYGHNIIFRDTLLLAPGGKQALSAIGGMYGDHLRKIGLSANQYQNMDVLLKEDPTLFKNYALRDSLISLVHGSVLEDAHFKLKKLGMPLTLSSLGVSNLRNGWKIQGYKGYQISKDYLLGDSRKMPTPKGLFGVGNVGLLMNNYIANYKGGRNESFMVGKDETTFWNDYDLTAAYTTAMAMLGDPNYELARRLSPSEIKDMSDNELLYSYTTIEVEKFRFPSSVTYPSIPCYSDEVTTVYPLTGKGLLTGAEYITARNQGCNFELAGGTLIPFKLKTENAFVDVSNNTYEEWRIIWENYKNKAFPTAGQWEKPLNDIFKDMPFLNIINDLQAKRREHEKGTISNLLYKEMGNSLYGSVTKGINHKVKFDIKTNRTVRMEASDISNPILASWITAYVRSVIGELLEKVQVLGGEVVSVTTDGFITDIADLEERVMGLPISDLKPLRSLTSNLQSTKTPNLQTRHYSTKVPFEANDYSGTDHDYDDEDLGSVIPQESKISEDTFNRISLESSEAIDYNGWEPDYDGDVDDVVSEVGEESDKLFSLGVPNDIINGPDPEPNNDEDYPNPGVVAPTESESKVEGGPLREKLFGLDKDGNILSQELLEGGHLGEVRLEVPFKTTGPKRSGMKSDTFSLLKEYRKMRKFLSGDERGLELKHTGRGLMSWTTRGQISVEMGMKAITGLQTRDLTLSESWGLMSVSGLGQTIDFASTSLRSAIDIYKKGGHVTMDYSDRDFRIMYNNNRVVLENTGDEEVLLRTKPVVSVEESLTQRCISRLTRGSLYQKYTSIKSINKYRNNLELGLRAFLKDVLNNRNGVNMTLFAGYKGLLDFVHKYVNNSGEKLNWCLDSSYVSQLKLRTKGKIPKPRMVPRLPSIMKFFDYVKESYPDYDTSNILAKS